MELTSDDGAVLVDEQISINVEDRFAVNMGDWFNAVMEDSQLHPRITICMKDWKNTTHVGDCRELLIQMAADGVRTQTCVTSPPYFGLRDYGVAGQIGLESSPEKYVEQLVAVFRAVREVLSEDGTCWLNLGDSYANDGKWGGQTGGKHVKSLHSSSIGRSKKFTGLKPKDLLGIPWRVAFALQADGWYLRSDIIWHKPNSMPESITDRPTRCHEYLFLLARSEHYYYDATAIRERVQSGPSDVRKMIEARPRIGGKHKALEDPLSMASASTNIGQKRSVGNGETRNRRSVWTIATVPFNGPHFATFPPALVAPCILAGSRPGDIVLDPFMGSETTGQVSTDLGRAFIGCEINPRYIKLHAMRRTTIGMPI